MLRSREGCVDISFQTYGTVYMAIVDKTKSDGFLLKVRDKIFDIFPGLLVAATIALAATFLSEHYNAPVMLFALLLGMAFNFLSEEKGKVTSGIQFSSKGLLRIAVGLLGARITFSQIMELGLTPIIIVIMAVILTILVGSALARLFGQSTQFGVLTSGAVAICGASAAMAISTVLPHHKNHERDTIFAVVAVTTLSTIAMIAYPMLISLFNLNDAQIGIFLGGTIHDVAQVVGAGYTVSQEAGDVATFTKLLRVSMLLPVVIIISLIFLRRGNKKSVKGTFPSFLLVFAALVVLNSLGIIPESILEIIRELSRWFLVTAIAALGMKTSLKQMASVGGKAISLIVAQTFFIALLVLAALFIGV